MFEKDRETCSEHGVRLKVVYEDMETGSDGHGNTRRTRAPVGHASYIYRIVTLEGQCEQEHMAMVKE